ncbi:hypothetical protein PHIN6_13290 [Polynucleobacter sp. HIN6]|nr:hypothetical protein PHIN6_13290 [Polynucleobacter sp. HIN6]
MEIFRAFVIVPEPDKEPTVAEYPARLRVPLSTKSLAEESALSAPNAKYPVEIVVVPL